MDVEITSMCEEENGLFFFLFRFLIDGRDGSGGREKCVCTCASCASTLFMKRLMVQRRSARMSRGKGHM